MCHCCSELKTHIRSKNPSREECTNVCRLTLEEDVIPESADKTAGTKSPSNLFAGEENDGYVNEGLERMYQSKCGYKTSGDKQSQHEEAR